jgi:hypothetical protein
VADEGPTETLAAVRTDDLEVHAEQRRPGAERHDMCGVVDGEGS